MDGPLFKFQNTEYATGCNNRETAVGTNNKKA